MSRFQVMVRRYRHWLHLAQGARALKAHAEQMEFIALNAGITAANSEENRAPLMILAREASIIAKNLARFAGTILASTQDLIQRSLTTTLHTRLHGHWQPHWLAHQPLSDNHATNIAKLATVAQQSERRYQDGLRHATSALEAIQDEVSAFSKYQRRVRMIAIYFRTEASRDRKNEAFFRDIANQLVQLDAGLHTTMEQLLHHSEDLTFAERKAL